MATAPTRIPDDLPAPDVQPQPDARGQERLGESTQDVLATRGGDPSGHTPTAAELTTRDEGSAASHQHPTLDQIAAEAYAIYMANGSQHGRDLDDWLEAERRIRSERA